MHGQLAARPGSGLSAEDVTNWSTERLAAYKYPRAIEFCAALPRTETGKLQRFRLKQAA